jgi:hypothetical protein
MWAGYDRMISQPATGEEEWKMSDEFRDDNTPNHSEDLVTLDRDTISDLQARFGMDMRVRSRRGPITRVIKSAAPRGSGGPFAYDRQDYDRNHDRDDRNDYDRDEYDRNHDDRDDYDREYDRDDYDRDKPGYDREHPGYDREDYDRDSPH